MRYGRIIVLLSAFIYLSLHFAANADTPRCPDFAYPKTVSFDSQKSLERAIKDADAPGIVRALTNFYLAETAVSADYANAAIEKIDSVANLTADPVLKSVLLTLEANIYASIYNGKRWVYNSRTTPATPIPTDYNEWNGFQFRHKVSNLLDAALANESELKRTPITSYSAVIDFTGNLNSDSKPSMLITSTTTTYYPTLYDFVAANAIRLLTSVEQFATPLSWKLLTSREFSVALSFSRQNPTAAKVLEIYASLLSFHEPGSAPFINYDIERLDFIAEHVYDNDAAFDESVNSRCQRILREMFEEYSSSEYSGDILLAIPDDKDNASWLYTAINRNLQKFPAYARKNALINKRINLTRQSLRISNPLSATPGSTVDFKLSISNVKSGKIHIYDVSSSPLTENTYLTNGLPKMTPVAVIPFKSTIDEIPFAETITVSHRFSTPGCYIAIPTIDGVTATAKRRYDKIRVTAYTLASTKFDTTKVYALDAMSGAPVKRAKITLNPQNSKKQPINLGLTNTFGAVDSRQSGIATITVADDRFASPLWIYAGENNTVNERWYPATAGYSSLPLYHPGDTVGWMAIVYEYRNSEHRPIANKEVIAILRDANRLPIDSLKLTSDGFGRVAGSFALPTDGLTGRFTISLDKYPGVISFTVSDYKLPTFRIVLEQVENDFPTAGDATLRGKVETYTGFPIADAKISLNLSAMPRARWWWNNPMNVKFATLDSAVTDASGKFEIVMTKELFDLSPLPDSIFSAEVSATTPSGETQSATENFSLGTRYIIQLSATENIDISQPTNAVKVKIVNYQDSVVDIPVNFSLVRGSETMMKGVISTNKSKLDLTSLPSGVYNLNVSLPDSTQAASVSRQLTLYRPTDSQSPIENRLLWYPSDKISFDATATEATWLYAVDCPTNLLVTVISDSKILSQRWVKSNVGMHSLPISLPIDVDKATVDIALTGNYRNAQAKLTVERETSSRQIKFVTESFRDHIVPDSEETWTFRVIDGSGKGQQAAVMLGMQNSAIDALASSRWTFTPSIQAGRHFSWRQNNLTDSVSTSINHTSEKYRTTNPLYQPEFDTYGRSLNPTTTNLYIRGTRQYKSASSTTSMMLYGSSNDVAVEEAEVENSDTADEAAESADMGSADEKTTEGQEATKFTYRDSEVPLAFFKPMMTTDAEGRLTLTFTVPNANAGWNLRALAYTDSLFATSFTAQITADKPVMVQPNLPRFVRSNDRVEIFASVMNNSNVRSAIQTTIEIFNPSDGKIIYTQAQTDTVAARSSAIAMITLSIPNDMAFVGYRIKSTNGRFADGEQSLIPILPSATPVIDSYPFYIAPESKNFTLTLPKVPANARMVLEFCNNPTWYVVTALPGLLDKEASTSIDAATSIFSAAIASGLLRDNPNIAKAVRVWTDSRRDDSTLTSMLERNQDLKQILLTATPWMLDARNDNERMDRLALLFDSKMLESSLATNVATLGKLVRDNGGWAWFGLADKASTWATEQVLTLFGELHRLGFMPQSKELTMMTVDALTWLNSMTTDEYRDNPKADFSTYVYLHTLFKGFADAPAPNRTIVASTIQRILTDWQSASIARKGIYAQILAANSYPTVAKTILASLREYSTYKPETGMWWASLDNGRQDKIEATAVLLTTFAIVEPGCQDSDRIRQWLIREKETTSWGSSVATSYAIAAFITSSAKWLNESPLPEIKIGGKTLAPNKYERLTGYFRSTLDVKQASAATLNVSRNDDTPSWGAVYSLHTDPTTEIKAKSLQGLSIEKKISIADNEEYASTSLTVGNRVRVSLTIRTDRDLEYVTVVDERPACFEPESQLPTPLYADGICFYRENRDSSTRLFIDRLPKGVYVLTYDVLVNNAGTIASGIATIQSQYAPAMTARSAGSLLTVMANQTAQRGQFDK